MRTRRGQWEPKYLQTEISKLIQNLFVVEYQDLPPNIAVCRRLNFLLVETRNMLNGELTLQVMPVHWGSSPLPSNKFCFEQMQLQCL